MGAMLGHEAQGRLVTLTGRTQSVATSRFCDQLRRPSQTQGKEPTS
jgi:hypothetical protein